jgi:hypothetical protein
MLLIALFFFGGQQQPAMARGLGHGLRAQGIRTRQRGCRTTDAAPRAEGRSRSLAACAAWRSAPSLPCAAQVVRCGGMP